MVNSHQIQTTHRCPRCWSTEQPVELLPTEESTERVARCEKCGHVYPMGKFTGRESDSVLLAKEA